MSEKNTSAISLAAISPTNIAFALSTVLGKGAPMGRTDYMNDFLDQLANDDPYAGLYQGELLEDLLLDPVDQENEEPTLTHKSFSRRLAPTRNHPWRSALGSRLPK